MNEKNLRFFNKEGDCLNFNYNNINNRYEGDILFHENSSDTFKTYGLYVFENIPSFEFESPNELFLNKFQLFNEHGIKFYQGKYHNQQILNIEPTNNDPNFYSKWIYGNEFDIKFPIGTIIKFDSTLLEYSNLLQTYTVVSIKSNAIMILSTVDNATFESTYYSEYINEFTYINKSISSINAIGIYDYINNDYSNNLSSWNEPNFYDKLYKNKKLNIINSSLNDGIFTIYEENLTDLNNFEYCVSNIDNNDIIIEISTNTDLPKIYNGSLDITNDGKLVFGYSIPYILKPGTEFKILGSNLNNNFLTVKNIPNFKGNTQQTYYHDRSQVIWNNKIYECISPYTQSFSGTTSLINPTNTSYWTPYITYLSVNQQTYSEHLSFCQLYLTTNKIYFYNSYTHSNSVTLSSTAEKYKDDFKLFNIDLYYENNILKADLIYPTRYADVNFYLGKLGPTYSVGTIRQIREKIIQLSENVENELNYDLSNNHNLNIVFDDLDDYGLKIIIDNQVYEEEISWVYSGSSPDIQRTIDRTLRSWLNRNHIRLLSIGIISDLKYTGSLITPFYNTISLITEYPNVPMYVNNVLVGTTANYYIEHSKILFNSIGSYLNIRINDEDYEQSTIYLSGTYSNYPDIPNTLKSWTYEHKDYLKEYGIIVNNINNLLELNVTNANLRIDLSINTGESTLPWNNNYTITNKINGNDGIVISSNEIVLSLTSSYSFKNYGFATGMISSINNTFYPYNNQEYNIQYVDDKTLGISYQGPFWQIGDNIHDISPYVTLSFDNGFGQSPYLLYNGITSSIGGPFNPYQFSSAFSISYNLNTYNTYLYNLSTYPGTSNLVDLIYVQISNMIYGLGDDLVFIDANIGSYLGTIDLPYNMKSIKIKLNPINNYLYCLSINSLYIIDPLINSIINILSFDKNAFDIQININNGDVYISYENDNNIKIYDYNNNYKGQIQTISNCNKLIFNDFDGDMYSTDKDSVIRINGDYPISTSVITYGIPGVTSSIYYEPVNESIYVYGSSSLWKIDNGLISSIQISTGTFNDIVFNNLTNEMNISDSSTSFKSLNLNTDLISYSTDIGNYGYMAQNQYDGDIYLSSLTSNSIIIIKSINGSVIHVEPMGSATGRLIYNPDRKSIWSIQPNTNTLVEIKVILNSTINTSTIINENIDENLYGTLDPDYKPHSNMWIKTKNYLRKPRENYKNDVSVTYYWKWYSDNVPEFFLYDFSGNQLPSIGSYAYNGTKPLTNIILNKTPNTDITKTSLSEYQQTIFDKIEEKLSYIDDEYDISSNPEPMQLFIGFKSENEGALRSILQLWKKEDISIEYDSTLTNNTELIFETLDIDGPDKRGQIKINSSSNYEFTNKGLKEGQNIVLYLKDITNNINQYISNNNGLIVKIRNVFYKTIIVDFIDIENDYLEYEETSVIDYPNIGDITYLKTTITVIDKEIGRFYTYGQTEIEDIRFKIELGNEGKLITSKDVFIFKEYDILEGGVDWTFLNKKRKEMLMMKHLIYPYIGSYKSIINAINFFGYNDLQLNEYYRNINPTSEKFLKLFKVEIPNIFDNSIDGWDDDEYVVNNFPNEDYEDTNMFNLTYLITDKDGNNVINYSIDDIVIKLQGLKYWLKRNIIPLTHKILDITGKSFFKSENVISHTSYDIKFLNIRENMTPITFKINESYLMPINSGSTVYNCCIDFYTIINGVGSYNSDIKSFNGSILNPPDYFDILIKTYKTYKEWTSFTTYNMNDKVIYYGKLYESVIDNNKMKNPKKYDNISLWDADNKYEKTNIVKYDKYIYINKSETYSYTEKPNLDDINWMNITEWVEIDLEPVQTIKEYRRLYNGLTSSNILLPFNFTIDSNIDPFIVIEVTSDNGYGLIYKDKKNYEIRGIKDISDDVKYLDIIGPFVPISPVY